MADATLQNVFDAARANLGADATGGSAVYTNAVLQPHFAIAYRELYRVMASLGNPHIERKAYFVVPANTGYVAPSTAGINDLGEPIRVRERGNLTQKTISGVSGTTTVTVTATSHGFSTGDIITVGGVVGLSGTDGVWAITVSDANSFVLNGCVGSGTYSSGGVAVKSGEEFDDVVATDQIDYTGSTVSADRFRVYEWTEDAFRFPPCSTTRQIEIKYYASGTAPSSTSANIGIDDALDFLSVRTAALAANSRGAIAKAQALNALAIGPTGQADASGGLLRELLANGVRALQRIPPDQRRRRPFRDPRSLLRPIF